MVYRIYVEKKKGLDNEARALQNDLRELLGIKGLEKVRLLNRYDCEGLEDFSLRNELQNRYPLATWLAGTPFSRTLRQRSTNPQLFHHGGENEAQWVMEVPGSVWTLEPVNSGSDCCWTIPDFAKCSSNVPLNFVCLKDCDNIFDTMV